MACGSREIARDELEFAEGGHAAAIIGGGPGRPCRPPAACGKYRSPRRARSAMMLDRGATPRFLPLFQPSRTMSTSLQRAAELRRAALDYHEFPTPGKIAIAATKQLVNQHDLALAYSPGVAAACEEIVADPANAFRYTARGNLVAVITNGTAVLGLGDIGPLAAKPVMEGKGVLFQEVRRHRRVRHRGQGEEPRQADRPDRRARANLRRHQPRGHQGARLLLRRARPALADEHPRLPRRPARYRHRRRRRRAQCAQSQRQEDRRDQARHLGCGCCGARLPGPAGQAGACRARTSGSPTWPVSSTRAASS